MNTPVLRILSGGAAQGLVRQLQPGFEARHGCRIEGTFGAVGAMKDKLLAGAEFDVLILTEALVAELGAQGHVHAASARPLGRVKTGVAVKEDAASVDLHDAAELKALLMRAGGIYFPDPAKATAGIHFMKVLQALGLADSGAAKFHTFPNGATAMAALAQSPDATAVGCTQVTEILITPGVRLVSVLPPPFELATVYTAAVGAQAQQAALANALIAAFAHADAAAVRATCGFE